MCCLLKEKKTFIYKQYSVSISKFIVCTAVCSLVRTSLTFCCLFFCGVTNRVFKLLCDFKFMSNRQYRWMKHSQTSNTEFIESRHDRTSCHAIDRIKRFLLKFNFVRDLRILCHNDRRPYTSCLSLLAHTCTDISLTTISLH